MLLLTFWIVFSLEPQIHYKFSNIAAAGPFRFLFAFDFQGFHKGVELEEVDLFLGSRHFLEDQMKVDSLHAAVFGEVGVGV